MAVALKLVCYALLPHYEEPYHAKDPKPYCSGNATGQSEPQDHHHPKIHPHSP